MKSLFTGGKSPVKSLTVVVYKCSFCGEDSITHSVSCIIRSPQANICDQGIERCVDLMNSENNRRAYKDIFRSDYGKEKKTIEELSSLIISALQSEEYFS